MAEKQEEPYMTNFVHKATTRHKEILISFKELDEECKDPIEHIKRLKNMVKNIQHFQKENVKK